MPLSKLRPKQLIDTALPGIGDQYEVGLAFLGSTIVKFTAGNSAMTDAQIIASPPNTAAGNNAGVVVQHSLGTAPSWAIAVPFQTSAKAVFAVVTADNSAVYLRVAAPDTTGGALGVSAQLLAIR